MKAKPITRESLIMAGVAPKRIEEILGAQEAEPKAKEPKPKHRSKLEAEFEQVLKARPDVIKFWYEPCSFKLCDGKRYRPDFIAFCGHATGAWSPVVIAYEVKGSWKAKNQRDAHTHLKWFAQLYGEMFHSVEVAQKISGKWTYQEVTA